MVGAHQVSERDVGRRKDPLQVLANPVVLGVALTLGFYKPFAVVRLTEYFLSRSTVVVSGSLNDFVAGEQLSVGAAGEEAVEMFDLDLAV